MQTKSLNRIGYRALQLQRLVADLKLPREAKSLLATRLKDRAGDLDGPMASLRRKQLAYMLLALATATGALVLGDTWVMSSLSDRRILATCLLLIASLSALSARRVRTQRWLRSHIVWLGLANELLGLAEKYSIVRTYVECVVELFPWPIGLDVQIARELAKQNDNALLPAEPREAAAMQKLRQLPYPDDIFT